MSDIILTSLMLLSLAYVNKISQGIVFWIFFPLQESYLWFMPLYGIVIHMYVKQEKINFEQGKIKNK